MSIQSSPPLSKPSALTIEVPIIGIHRSPLPQKFGMPRQPNLVQIPSVIEMLAPYNTLDAFVGIEDFSHLWITWQTHHNKAQKGFRPQVRPPRLGGNDKLGVFATRSTYRPSQLGLSVVGLLGIETMDKGVKLHISGADMVDGTPIIDIKPYVAYSDAIPGAVSGFAPKPPVNKPVQISPKAQSQFDLLLNLNTQNSLSNLNNRYQPTSLTPNDVDLIQALIAQDPRPAYRQHETGSMFTMRYKSWDIGFKMDEAGVLWLVDISDVA